MILWLIGGIKVEIYTEEEQEKNDWIELGMSRLEEEWDNPEDAIYDDLCEDLPGRNS